MQQKTVMAVSPDNLRSSCPDAFLKVAVPKNSREVPGITGDGGLLIAKKNNTLGNFIKFFRTDFLTFLGGCFFGL